MAKRGARPSRAAASRSARIARACAMNSSATSRSAAFHCVAHRLDAALGDQRLVARQKFLDLHRVIGQRLGRGVDRGQPAADHDDRQSHGQVGDAVGLGGAGQLQRHQEIGGLPHPGREAVLHRDHGRPAGAGAQRDMVEAEIEGAVDRQRAAEADAAIHRELRPPLEQQADDLQEILVPAHRDAVLGDAAEPGHRALVEPLDRGSRRRASARTARARRSAMTPRDFRRQRLDLQPVDRGDEMPVIDQMVRQGEPGRAETDDQHLVADCRLRQRPAQVERVPAGQQAVDLEAPGQRQHVLQRAGLDLRDVDRLLPLVDAGLHAVVADAVPGRGAERVVDRDDRQRADAVAARLDEVHLRDLLVERAAVRALPRTRFCVKLPSFSRMPDAAAVLPLVVAPDAVIRLVERAGEVGAGIGQRKPVARPPVVLGQAQHRDAVPHRLSRPARGDACRAGAARGTAGRACAGRARPASASPRRHIRSAARNGSVCAASSSSQRATASA